MSLQPKRIIFMLDKGLELENTFTNINHLLSYMKMSDVKVFYWDWRMSHLPDKSSPTDHKKKELLNIIKNELCIYNREGVSLSKSYGTSEQTAEDYLTLIL